MRFAIALAAVLLLSACAPALPQFIAPPAGGISAEEAGVIVMRATATAGAVATQSAGSTATAAAYGFGVRETEDAQRFASTAIAIVKLEADTQATQAQAIAAAELAAVNARHQAELDTIEEGRKREEAARLNVENANARLESRDRWNIIWWSMVTAFVCSTVVAVGYVISVGIERSLPKVARGIYRARYPELPAPADNVIDAEVTEAPPPSKSRLNKWREYLIDFCEFAERPPSPELSNTQPFSERRLDLVGIEQPTWQDTIGWLVAAGVLVKTNRAKNSSAAWRGDWSLSELRRQIYVLPIPYPAAIDPPRVDASVCLREQIQ